MTENNANTIVRPINHNTLTDEEANILRNAVKKIRDRRLVSFDVFLEEASSIVATWPKWKREALGVLSNKGSKV